MKGLDLHTTNKLLDFDQTHESDVDPPESAWDHVLRARREYATALSKRPCDQAAIDAALSTLEHCEACYRAECYDDATAWLTA